MSTNFTKRAFWLIPQFDFLTLGAQVFGLLFNLTLLYYFNIKIIVPRFAGVKKFRTKKLRKNIAFISTMSLERVHSKKLINNSYKEFIQ